MHSAKVETTKWCLQGTLWNNSEVRIQNSEVCIQYLFIMRQRLLFLPLFLVLFVCGFSQDLQMLKMDQVAQLEQVRRLHDEEVINVPGALPVFSFVLNGRQVFSNEICKSTADNTWEVSFQDLAGDFRLAEHDQPGLKYLLTLTNTGDDTLVFENVVPFGGTPEQVYITSTGPWQLARAKLFRPGYPPVRVMLPDNAWELGYGAVGVNNDLSLCAIARRTGYEGSERRRYETLIPPGAHIEYTFYVDTYTGEWQNGLRLMFRDRWLYDLVSFDNSLYERPDLQWIKKAYIIFLEFAWDQSFYNAEKGAYLVREQVERGNNLYGGFDILGIWPTWPRLGVDERNQFDMYADMPGGLDALRQISDDLNSSGIKFFISYNPWDKSTRPEDQYEGLSALIASTHSDGVVIDTRGKSSLELQAAADKARPGVIMYSEGMAIPVDMPGIISGRVHNAIRYQPELNLNKMIKPDFGIFRVAHISEGRLHRETAISFFNGYGTEVLTFGPGVPAWIDEELTYLGKTTMILRENQHAFQDFNWTPMVSGLKDSIWINGWNDGEKGIFTIFSLDHNGYEGPLFESEIVPGRHYVSLWSHHELDLVTVGEKTYIPASIRSFNQSWQGTRMAGNVDCVAGLPVIIEAKRYGDFVRFKADQGDLVRVWLGDPSYQDKPVLFETGEKSFRISDYDPVYQDKVVIQLFEQDRLLDERILEWPMGTPWLVSEVSPAPAPDRKPSGMVLIHGGEYEFLVSNPDQFIPYPDYSKGKKVELASFYIDTYPVTNQEYYRFIRKSGYQPADPANYLKHWDSGKYVKGTGNQPVVYVSYEDARAYAEWAGKRLPTEIEWQYAAQGRDGRTWPWGNDLLEENYNAEGKGRMPVDAHPAGASELGVCDLVGNVWQMTNDVYFNGNHRMLIIRGGSYYNPTSSIWYVRGGPQPLDQTQMLLLVAPGYDRCATVGFRCVMDR